jgi:hypothetical protein
VLLNLYPTNQSVRLLDPKTKETAVLPVGAGLWGWELAHVGTEYAVVSQPFDEWAAMEFIYPTQARSLGAGKQTVSIRKPVGRLNKLSQPLYSVLDTDPDYSCKQDIDPTDWLSRVAANISVGGTSSLHESPY